MDLKIYEKLSRQASGSDALARTIAYVTENLGRFLREREHVMICFSKDGEDSLGCIFEQAVVRLGAVPEFWGSDRKWKTLLRQTFASRAKVIVGPPLVILSLSKLAKATGTPLNIRHVVTAGYPCLDWMIDGMIRGLDCRTWGCFGPGTGALVSGFSCGASFGVHVREDTYDFQIQDADGNPVEEGTMGSVTLASRDAPNLRLRLKDHARMLRSPCSCGQTAPRLMDIHPLERFQDNVLELYQQLHSWTSILDCRVVKGEYGLELELVVFPGEKLPKLPTCAKQVIRPWDPDKDVPLDFRPAVPYF